MIGLIQRVIEAEVTVEGELAGHIGRGLVVLVAVQPADASHQVSRLVDRVLTYRVFCDASGRMNESLMQQGLELLAIPQFTLAADTRKGTRPSFTGAASPDKGREFFEMFLQQCRTRLPGVASGRFGADMRVSMVNDGPATFWLES